MADPIVTNISPVASSDLGRVAGFSFTAEVVSAVDDAPYLQVSALFADGHTEIIYRKGQFTQRYQGTVGTIEVPEVLGFEVFRPAGWPSTFTVQVGYDEDH